MCVPSMTREILSCQMPPSGLLQWTATLGLHSHPWLVAVEEGTNHTVFVYLAVEKDNILSIFYF